MASKSGIFFSAQGTLQIQAAAGHSIIFGNFLEITAPMSLFLSSSSSELGNL
jgi:hypothetical protein